MSRLRKNFLNLLIILLLVKAFIFFARAVSVIVYPFEWSTMDGYFVYYGLRLISGKPIYFGYESILMPFEYVPLYPAFIGVLAKLFGPGVWYERGFGVLCSLATAAIIAGSVARRTGDRLAAAAAGLMFFAPPVLSVWYLVRGLDVLALLVALAGVYILARNSEEDKLLVALPTALFVLAFFAKQTTVFQCMAAIVFVFCQDRKKGFIMAAGFAVAVLAISLLFQVVTGGWFFENAFLTTSKNPFYPSLFLDLLKNYSLCLFIALPVALWQALRGMKRRPDIWTLYFLFSLLSTCLAGKIGAALSYFLPLFSSTCICVGLFLAGLNHLDKRPKIALATVILIVVQAGAFYRTYLPVPTPTDRQQAAFLNDYIGDNPGKILTERIDSFATLNQRELNIEAVQLPVLVMRKKFNIGLLTQAIENKEFSVIVYSGIYFGGIHPLKQAIFDNYEVVDRISMGLFYGSTTFVVLSPR